MVRHVRTLDRGVYLSYMDRIVVHRSGPLSGSVDVPGAKNSVLKLMVASLFAEGRHELTNVPGISDVDTMGRLLGALGVDVHHHPDKADSLCLDNTGDLRTQAPSELVESIRASINLLGPLLACRGRVRLDLPGGDDFGGRPIDMHIAGLSAMGVEFEPAHDYIEAHADRLHGADIVLDFPSVGATENLVTAAVHAEGSTTIRNAAREPEIADLCTMLTEMGAQISGIGSTTLTIVGVPRGSLVPVSHAVVGDRIQAATYLAAVAVAGGDVTVTGSSSQHMEVLLRRMHEMGPEITAVPGGVRIESDGYLRAVDVQTLPYPGIGTDYKPLLVTMLAVAEGIGIVMATMQSSAASADCEAQQFRLPTSEPARRSWSQDLRPRVAQSFPVSTTSTAAMTTSSAVYAESERLSNALRSTSPEEPCSGSFDSVEATFIWASIRLFTSASSPTITAIGPATRRISSQPP